MVLHKHSIKRASRTSKRRSSTRRSPRTSKRRRLSSLSPSKRRSLRDILRSPKRRSKIIRNKTRGSMRGNPKDFTGAKKITPEIQKAVNKFYNGTGPKPIGLSPEIRNRAFIIWHG